MKKILIFSLAYYPKHIGGAEVAIKEVTDRISPAEYEFHMITNRYDSTLPKVEQVGNVLVHRIGIVTKHPKMEDLRKWPLHLNKGLFQFLAYLKARSLHKRYGYGGIWGMMAHAAGVPTALFKGAFPDVKYALTLQEGDPPEYIEKKMYVFGALFKRAFTKADIVQVISMFLSKWARANGCIGRIEVIPNGVNTLHFSQVYSERELKEIRESVGKKSKDVYLVTTSRLVKKNAVDDVIAALPLLPPHVKFLVFGTGPEETVLRELAKEKHVADRVIFWGQLDHAIMPLYLKVCDIFIRPSRSEGMGNSFVEAFAAELPVIATQEGGIADFLFDERRNPNKPTTGWAVDANSPEQIAEAVRDILGKPEKVKEVLKTAKTLAESRYDWDSIAADMRVKVFDPLFE